MNLPRQLPPSFQCIHCSKFFAILTPYIPQLYVKAIEIPCPNCKGTLDVWDLMIKSI
jgi:hypothetical protein